MLTTWNYVSGYYAWSAGVVNITSAARVVMKCFFFQAEDGIRDLTVTGVQTCALPILSALRGFFGRQRLDRQGVYLATHELPQRAVHELVARETLLALELLCHHARGKMGDRKSVV